MLFRRRKHKLPSFPPEAARTFKKLCEALPVETVPQLRDEVRAAYEQIMDLSVERPLIDTKLVRELYDRSLMLLEVYDRLATDQRSLVIGALRYFASAEDGFSDTYFASGYDDDVRVMNYVLEELGFKSQYIDID